MSKGSPIHHTGLEGIQAAPIVARLALEAGDGAKAIVVTATQGAAATFAKTLSFFLGKKTGVFALPEDDPPFLRADARSREAETARLLAMAGLSSEGPAVVVCPVSALIRDVCSREAFASARFELYPGAGFPRDELIKGLAGSGYRRVPYTEGPGEFSARGDIVDVFPIDCEEPWRVSFFDTEIDSLGPFDPVTQKSKKPRASRPAPGGATEAAGGRDDPQTGLVIAPAAEPCAEGLTLADWLFSPGRPGRPSGSDKPDKPDRPGSPGVFVCIDPDRILRALELRETEALADFEMIADAGEASGEEWGSYRGAEFWGDLVGKKQPHLFSPDFTAEIQHAIGTYKTVRHEARHAAAFYGQLDLLSSELKSYLRRGFTVTIVASTEARLDSLREFAEQEGLADKIFFAEGELPAGFEIASEKRAWLWDGDIFKAGKKSRRARVKGHEKISAFTDIDKGDYIVHEKYGIGVYKGIKTIETYGNKRDYLTIEYADKDMFYLPVEQMDRVQKYVGGGERKPRISRLGSDEWTRAKARVRAEIEEYAGELIRLAAERRLAPGFAFSPDTVWQKDFEDRFPYEPTPDQVRCFDAVRRDMENPWPMDRLICGDVGYGKTEVALRAVFKCVQDGKQAAVLVPTTILASQHYRTFAERFADFPVRVETLSRFNSAAEQKIIIEAMKRGAVDIVIGTHALLSPNVVFKDLGLLIIDEEQRFGVKHKERIRAMRAGVDVLTLTATPIPRTLNMSLLGIKDMELIEDPPEDRYPVRTFVSEERPDVISESIRRELDRGGQVYIVYNRVVGIEHVAEKIRALAPQQARLGVCHAKMNERAIEAVMQDFYENEFDILLSTTIIESGLDIPNVNTMLILDADRLGLTQLYQLRGRVGRTNRIAFAYLMYRRDKALTENAEKRLRTIREFTEFGSGFKIAMKDLEIRGAGNLLGISQHGHMAAVGYEMYCKLMDEAVARLAGRAPAQSDGENECRVEFAASAVIPPDYIEDEIVKLQAYRRISFVDGEAQAAAVIEELSDRFGPVPASVLALIRAAWLRRLGERAGIFEIKLGAKRAEFIYREAPEKLMESVFKASERAHGAGAALEADMKAAPKLKLVFAAGAADNERFETTTAVLSALGAGNG